MWNPVASLGTVVQVDLQHKKRVCSPRLLASRLGVLAGAGVREHVSCFDLDGPSWPWRKRRDFVWRCILINRVDSYLSTTTSRDPLTCDEKGKLQVIRHQQKAWLGGGDGQGRMRAALFCLCVQKCSLARSPHPFPCHRLLPSINCYQLLSVVLSLLDAEKT